MDALDRHIEAILFSAEQPVAVSDLVDTLNKAHDLDLDKNVVENHLEGLLEKYDDEHYPFQVVNSGGGYQFLSKKDYHKSISIFLNLKSRRKLSVAAMETLSIIAYKQPVTKPDIENIRGVNCDYSIQKLLEKDLIAIVGRSESPGKPLLYGTSKTFMDYFGINTLDDLPKLKEFENVENVLGIPVDAVDLPAPAAENGEAADIESTDEAVNAASDEVEAADEADTDDAADTDSVEIVAEEASEGEAEQEELANEEEAVESEDSDEETSEEEESTEEAEQEEAEKD